MKINATLAIAVLFVLASDATIAARPSGSLTESAPANAGPSGTSAPQLERLLQSFVGIWSVKEQYPQAHSSKQNGTGTEEWQAGPERKWAIYKYSSLSSRGKASALALFWWDTDAQALREVWCFGIGKAKCEISAATVEWRGKQLVLEQKNPKLGHPFLETWSNIGANHHTTVIQEPGKDGKLHPTLITNATRKRPLDQSNK